MMTNVDERSERREKEKQTNLISSGRVHRFQSNWNENTIKMGLTFLSSLCLVGKYFCIYFVGDE